MAIDLNGTLAGVNNTIAYTEGGASISIAPAARVGAGSTSINSDQWVQIKVTMLNPQAGDLWSIKSLPLGMSVSSTSGGAPLPLPVDVSIVTSPVLYLNGGLFTTDSAWQTALAAIRYRDAGEVLPGESARQIDVLGRTSTGNGPTASVMVNMVPVNDAPVANADSGSALEAGGINNSTAGRPASGNVLMNDRDPDSAASSLRVIGVSQAGTAVPAGTAISGAYGWLVIQADGSYVYRVIDSLPIVQALRTGTQTLSESFTYTVQDDAGATSQAALTVTIAGRNDTPVATADAGMAVEQGESDPGRSASGNVLANDWDVDAGDALTVVSAGLVGQAAVGTGTALVGRYGTLTVAANGDYVYTADDSIPAVQALRGPGDTLADTFVYTVRDLAGATRSNTLTLTISGRNDAPVAEADEAIAVEAGGWRNGTLGVDPNGNVLANDRDPDGGDTFSVDIVSFGTRTGQVGQALQGAHGTLWLNADGSYRYAVNQTDPAVQALRRASDTLSETFSYGMRDAAGARSTATLTVTVRGQDDTPVGVGFGAVFDGTTATALCAGEDPGARRDFAIVFTATPMSTIVLHHNEGGHVDPLNSGQHFAIAPQRQSAWGDLNHASVGVSVGSNGVSVYADNGALTPLLTWAGEVQPQTRIAVIVQDNRPTLIIDGEVVRLGVSTPLQLHPGTQLGASAEHPADGFIGGLEGVRIWDGHYTPGSLALRELTSAAGSPGLLGQALNPQVSENAIAGTVVARAHTWDVDQGDSATYSLVDDANGRFVVNASTGVLSVADGARFDHETQPQVSVRVRSTDLSGQWTEQTLRIGVADANDAPTSAASSATMAEDNQIRLRATALGADPITNDQAGPPRVRLDEVPDALQGTLRLNGVAVAAGQVIAAADVARLAFQPRLFHVGAFAFDDQDTGDGLSAVRLDTLPATEQGLLTYQGQPVVAGLVVPADRLGDLSFEPVRDFNGIVTFRYSVCDWQGTFQATPGTFSLTVTAVNDTPAIAPVLTMDVREGGTTRLDGIRLNDVDAAGDEMVLTLRVSEGKLSANATPEVVVQGNGSDTLQLRGTLQALNALVQSEPGISYAAPHHEPPALNCTLMRLDNDPQAIDPLVRLVLSTQAGHLQAIGREGVTVSGSGTDCLSIEGLASVVEAFVQDEQSVKRLVPHPMAELTVTLDDQGHTGTDPGFTGTDLNEQDTRVMGLVLVPQGLPLATTEPTPDTGTAAPTHNTGLDPAAMAGVAAGTPLVIALGLQDRLRSVFVTGTADTVSQLQTTAARIELSEALHTLRGDVRYRALQLVALAPSADALTVVAGALAVGAAIAVGTVVVQRVLPHPGADTGTGGSTDSSGTTAPHLNERPTIGAPAQLHGAEDTALRITGLLFNDADAGDGTVRLTLRVPNGQGTLHAIATAGVQVLGDNSDTLTLLGTVTALQAFVNGAAGPEYQPAPDAHDHVSLTVTLNDMGNTGTDPGTSGTDHDEERTVVIDLDIASVNDAPTGHDHQATVIEGRTLVFGTADFPISDVDGDGLGRVCIESLPNSGQLLLSGRPLMAGTWVTRDQLDAGALRYQCEAGREDGPPSFQFLVEDDGGQSLGAAQLDPQAHLFTLEVLHTLRVRMDGRHSDGQATWRQDPNADLALFGNARLQDIDQRGQQVAAICIEATQRQPGDRWYLDDAYANLYRDATGAWPSPLEWTEDTQGRTLLRPTDGSSLTTTQAEALLHAIRYRNTLSAPDETPRGFTASLITSDGETSPDAHLTLTVRSTLGDALREAAAHENRLRDALDSGTGTAAGHGESAALVRLLDARAALADSAWQALGMARQGEHGNVVVGGMVLQALGDLGIDAPLVLEKTDDHLSAWTQTPLPEGLLLRDPASGLVWMSSRVQAQLLSRIGAVQQEQRQLAWQEVTLAIEAATPGDQADGALRLTGAAWLLDHLHGKGLNTPEVVHTDSPQSTLAIDQSAWVVTTSGDLLLPRAAWRELATQVELLRHADLNPTASPAALAFQALNTAWAEGTALLVSADLLPRLTAAGVPHGPVRDGNEDPTNALAEPGVLLRVSGGLLIAPATRDSLAGALMDQLIEHPSATSLEPLRDALAHASPASDPYYLPAHLLPQLQAMGFPLRWVEQLDALSWPGDVMRDAQTNSIALGRQSVAALKLWLQTLDTLPQVDVLPNDLAPSDALAGLRALQAMGTDAAEHPGLVALHDAPVLQALLRLADIEPERIERYRTLGMHHALAERFEAADTPLLDASRGVLYLPRALYTELAHTLQSELTRSVTSLDGTPLALPPSRPAAPTLAQGHDALAQASPQPTTVETLQTWLQTAQALHALLGTTRPQWVHGAALVNAVALEDIALPAVQQRLADAGISAEAVGKLSELSPAGLDALLQGTSPALALNDQQQVVIGLNQWQALQQHLQAQFFREKAQATEVLLHELMRTTTPDGVAVLVGQTLQVASAGDESLQGLVALSPALLELLRQVGVALPSIDAGGTQLTDTVLQALRDEPGQGFHDSARGLVWVAQATFDALVRDTAAQWLAARAIWCATEPEVTPVAVVNQHAMAALQAAEALPQGLVRVAVESSELRALHLAFWPMGAFDGSAEATAALALARCGTVQGDLTQPGHLVMSSATRDWLLAQNARLESLASALAFDPTQASQDFLRTNRLVHALARAMPDSLSGLLRIDGPDDLVSQLQQLGLDVVELDTLWPFHLSTDSPAFQIGAVVPWNGHYLVSQATLDAWSTALAEHALRVGGSVADALRPHELVLPDDTPAQIASTASLDRYRELAQQVHAWVTGAEPDRVQGSDGSHAIWRLPAQTPGASEQALQQLLRSADPPITALGTLDTASPASMDTLLGPSLAWGRAVNGDILVSAAAHEAIARQGRQLLERARAEVAWEATHLLVAGHQIEPETLPVGDDVPHVLPAAGPLGHIEVITALARLRDWPIALLQDSAELVQSLHNALAAHSGQGLMQLGPQLTVPLDGTLATVRDSGVFLDNALGRVRLAELPLGSVQTDNDGHRWMTPATAALLLAEARGLAAVARGEGTASATDELFSDSLRMLHSLQTLARETLAQVCPSPSPDTPPGWWAVFHDWVLVPTEGADLLAKLQALNLPCQAITLTSDVELANALHQGLLARPLTVVVDAQNHHLMSANTLQYLTEALALRVREAYGLGHDLLGLPEATHTVGKRQLQDQAQDTPGESPSFAEATQQLVALTCTPETVAPNTVAVPVDARALQAWLVRAANLGVNHTVVEIVGDGQVLFDGQARPVNGTLHMTHATAMALQDTLHQVAITLDLDSAQAMTEALLASAKPRAASQASDTMGGRLLVLHTNATVDDFLSRHPEVGRPQARDTDGRWHTIGLDTLRIAQAAYDKALASDTASALLNSTTTLVLPDGLGNATFTQAALLEAAQRLATNELAVAQDSRGDWWLSASTHQWLLREAAQEQWTARRELGQIAFEALDNASTDQGLTTLHHPDLIALLSALSVPLLEVNSANALSGPGTYLRLPGGAVQVAQATREAWVAATDAAMSGNDQAIHLAANALHSAQAIADEVDYLVQRSDITQLAVLATSADDPTGLSVLSIALPPGVLQAWQDKHWLANDLTRVDPTAPSGQHLLNPLHQTGQAMVHTGADGQVRLLVTQASWQELLERVALEQTSTAHTLVMLPDADALSALWGAGVPLVPVDSLLLRGQATNRFAQATALGQALQESPVGTVFEDAQGRAWMSADTARLAQAMVQALEHGATTPELTLAPAALHQHLAAYDALIERLAHTGATPSEDLVRELWAADAQQQLSTLGIDLQRDITGRNDTSLYANDLLRLRQAVELAGRSAEASLYEHAWRAIDYTDAHGQHQRVWQLDDPEGLLAQALERSHLSLGAPAQLLAGDLASQLSPGSCRTDERGRLYVCDATHQAMATQLKISALENKAALHNALRATLMQAQLASTEPLVLVNDPDTVQALRHDHRLSLLGTLQDAHHLDGAQRQALAEPTGGAGYFLTPDGFLVMQTADLLALRNSTAYAVPLQQSDAQDLEPPPAVMSVKAAHLAPLLQQSGHPLGHLLDAQGNPIDTTGLTASGLGDAQRLQLNQTEGLIVQGENGELLMSTDTWSQLTAQLTRESGSADEQLALALQQGLSADASEETGLVTLDGDGRTWTEALAAIGLMPSVIAIPSAMQAPDVANLLNEQIAVGMDAQGRLVMSTDTHQWLQQATLARGLQAAQEATGAKLSTLEAMPMLALPDPSPAFVGNASTAAVSGYGLRAVYMQATAMRAHINTRTAPDTMLADNMAQAIELVAKYISSTNLNEQDAARMGDIEALRQYLALQQPEQLDTIVDLRGLSLDGSTTQLQRASKALSALTPELNERLTNANTLFCDLLHELQTQGVLQANQRDWTRAQSLHGSVQRAVADLATTINADVQTLKKSLDLNGQYEVTDAELNDLSTLLSDTFSPAGGSTPVVPANLRAWAQQASDSFEALSTKGAQLQDEVQELTGLGKKLTDQLLQDAQNELKTSEQVLIATEKKALADGIQWIRLMASLGSIGLYVPGAVSDAVLYHRQAALTYTGTEAGRQWHDYYQGRVIGSALQAAGTLANNMQVPSVWYNLGPGTLDKWWDKFRHDWNFPDNRNPWLLGRHREPLGELALEWGAKAAATKKLGSVYTRKNLLHPLTFMDSDTWTVINGVAGLALNQYEFRPIGNYLWARHLAVTAGGLSNFIGNSAATSIPVERLHAWGLISDAALAQAWITQGSINAGGVSLAHFILSTIVPAMDVMGQSITWLLYGPESGASLYTAFDSALFLGIHYGTMAALPWLGAATLPSMLATNLFRVDSASAANAGHGYQLHQQLLSEGREVEAGVVYQQFWRDAMRATPYVNWLSGWLQIIDLMAGTLPGQGLTLSDFQNAVRQRVAAQENHPQADLPALSQAILDMAKALQAQENYHFITGRADDFPYGSNTQVRVIRSAQVSHVTNGEAATEHDLCFPDEADQVLDPAQADHYHNPVPVRVNLANTTGAVATYHINAPTSITLPDLRLRVDSPNIELDTRDSSADSTNRVIVMDPRSVVRGGAATDLYLLGQELTPIVGTDGRLLAGFIVDGSHSPGRDVVSFAMAPASSPDSSQGYHVHTGTNYQGFVLYQGIQQFVGSDFDDRFTRYGASGPSDTWVSVVTGTGWDKVDMRSGNNLVLIGQGSVHFNLDTTVSAANMALNPLDLANLRDQGPWANDGERYETLYANHFTAQNTNVVTLTPLPSTPGDPGATVHVYGHALAQDVVDAHQLRGPLHVSTLADGQTRVHQADDTDGAQTLEVTLDANVDSLIGTLGGDTFVFDQPTGIKQVVGMGGDDTYRINTAGMSITAGDGRALIELGIDALNTELNLGDGHRAQLHVKAPTAIASADEPPATVLARIDGGAHNTWIDASDANVELHVVAMDGWGTIQMGGLTRVTVGQDMDRLDIQCGQHAQWKELYIEMGDPGFDFDQLITADGQQGKFLKTVVDGQEVYETRWYHASGGYTELRYTGHESDNVEIAALNGTFVRPLDDLVASPLAHS